MLKPVPPWTWDVPLSDGPPPAIFGGGSFWAKMVSWVPEFQRNWLELEALVFYKTVVEELLNTETTNVGRTTNPTIGGFTTSIRDAQDFFHAGVPVFLVRRKDTVRGPMRIDSVDRLRTPESQGIELAPYNHIPYPIVFEGSPMIRLHYESQRHFFRDRHLPTLVGVVNHHSYTGHASSSSTTATPTLRPYGKSLYLLTSSYITSHSFVERPSSSSSKPPVVKKFIQYDPPYYSLMPTAIPTWERALKATKLPVRTVEESKGHVVKTPFPDPVLFLQFDHKRNVIHFNNWIYSRPGFQWLNSRKRLPPLALSRKFWKVLLFQGVATGHNVPGAKGSTLATIEEWVKPLGLSFRGDGTLLCEGVPLAAASPVARWGSQPLQLLDGAFPSGTIVTEVLWELSELNFRWSLVELDSQLFRPTVINKDKDAIMDALNDRYYTLCTIFGGDDCGLYPLAYIRPLPQSPFGLNHDDLAIRAEFLHRLARLVFDWNLPLTPVLAQWKREPSSVLVVELEAHLFEYICQKYADKFGAFLSVPRRVPVHVDSAASSST